MTRINLERLQAELLAKGLQAAVVTSAENLVYVSGVALVDEETRKWIGGVRNAAIITQSGEVTLIVAGSSQHQARRDSWVSDIRSHPWRPGDSPLEMIIAVLKEKGVSRGRIGVEETVLPVQLYRALAAALPSATFEDCSSLFAHARSVKTAEEIDQLRTAIAATEKALVAAFNASCAGDTEREVARRIIDNLYKHGADGVTHLWVYGGDQTTDKFRPPGNKRLGSGDLVRVDVGAVFGGYKSDVARMAIVGKPAERQQSTYRRLREVERRMIETIRPGIPAGKLIEVCASECERVGIPFPGPALLTHSIGVVTHDYPVVYEPSDQSILEPGMVLAVEPYTVVGTEKYAIEDDVLVTEKGAELLSAFMDTENMAPITDAIS